MQALAELRLSNADPAQPGDRGAIRQFQFHECTDLRNRVKSGEGEGARRRCGERSAELTPAAVSPPRSNIPAIPRASPEDRHALAERTSGWCPGRALS